MSAAAEMPRYKCHKEVWALKIIEVRPDNWETPESETNGNYVLFVESPFSPITVGRDWFMKHKPEVGGYYVTYEDGYRSYSPAKAFENGYSKIN